MSYPIIKKLFPSGHTQYLTIHARVKLITQIGNEIKFDTIGKEIQFEDFWSEKLNIKCSFRP